MANSLPSSSEDLRRSVVDLLWRQWSALGVAGQVAQCNAFGTASMKAGISASNSWPSSARMR